MARTQGTSARTQRLITVVAMCLLALTSSFAIGRVFVGTASTYEMLATGLASALLACAMERRNLLLATAVSALGMLVLIGLFVFPETTWFGLPTLETVRAAVRAAGMIGEQARIQVAPTAPLPPLLLAALTGTWAAIFSAHALAFRAGSPLLALLPPVALVAFADTVLEDFARPAYGVAFLVAATAVLFADSLRRVQGWGPVWASPGRHARLTSTAGRGARRVAAAAVAVAAISPLLIPGFGSKALLDFSSRSDQVRIDPLVSVQSQLDREDPIEVFEVDTPTPLYWRLVALPDFDGTSWKPEQDPFTIEVQPGAALTTNAAPDPVLSGPAAPIEVSFRTASDLALPWLPLPYLPLSTGIDVDGLRWDAEGGSLLLEDPVDAGTSYSVSAQAVRPTPDALRLETLTDSPGTSRYTQLPADFPDQITALAETWTEGATTTYDQVIAIQQRFNGPGSEFSYNQDVEPRNDSSALLEFLDNKQGFCQQFAATMAVMLRSIGIPARVAVGFTAGEVDDENGTLRVTTEEAHAWVEVLFPNYGWLTFEPTPGRQNPGAYPYIDPTSGECQASPEGGDCTGTSKPDGGQKGQSGQGTIQGPTGMTKERVRPGGLEPELRPGRGAVDPQIVVPEPERRITVRQVALGAVLLGVIAIALVPPARAWRRRRRLRRAAGEPRRLILTAYDVFTERAGELGFPREAGQTLEEYRARVMATEPLANGDLDRLTSLTADAAYSARDPQPGQAKEATQAAESVLKELRKRASFGQRVGGLYRRG